MVLKSKPIKYELKSEDTTFDKIKEGGDCLILDGFIAFKLGLYVAVWEGGTIRV